MSTSWLNSLSLEERTRHFVGQEKAKELVVSRRFEALESQVKQLQKNVEELQRDAADKQTRIKNLEAKLHLAANNTPTVDVGLLKRLTDELRASAAQQEAIAAKMQLILQQPLQEQEQQQGTAMVGGTMPHNAHARPLEPSTDYDGLGDYVL